MAPRGRRPAGETLATTHELIAGAQGPRARRTQPRDHLPFPRRGQHGCPEACHPVLASN